MRILHVSPSLARRDGGPSEVLRNLLPTQRERGHDVRLVTTDKGATQDELREWARTGIDVVRALPPATVTFAPGLDAPLGRLVGGADVLHVHSIHTYPTAAALRWAWWRHRPVVLQPHGALGRRDVAHRARAKALFDAVLERPFFGSVRAAVYSSDQELSDGRAALPHVQGHRVPLGASEELFGLPLARPAGRRLLFLGRVSPVKRLDLVLRALAEPALADCHLDVAGPLDPRLTEDPRETATRLGVAGSVTFHGQVSASERSRLLGQSHVLLMPSDSDSFGIAAAEAMAAGCPVVATAGVGLAREAAAAGAVRLSSQLPSELAAAADEVLHAGTALAATARAFARLHYSWPAVAVALDDVYAAVRGAA